MPGDSRDLPSTRPRFWRAMMWLLVVLSGYWLVDGFLAGREGNTSGLAQDLLLGATCLGLAGILGVRSARQEARDREAAAARAAAMLLVAELGRHDDDTLERIAGSRGSAADAARMILQGRHLGNPAGSPRHARPES